MIITIIPIIDGADDKPTHGLCKVEKNFPLTDCKRPIICSSMPIKNSVIPINIIKFSYIYLLIVNFSTY